MLASKCRLHDTCGVHNLHGMPAVLSGIASAIYAALATKDQYKNDLFDIYPARMEFNSSMAIEQNSTYTRIIGVHIYLCIMINYIYYVVSLIG